jgi:hypothetical protein
MKKKFSLNGLKKGFNHLVQQGHHMAVVLKSDNEEKVQHSLGKLGMKGEKNDEQDTTPQNTTETTPNQEITEIISINHDVPNNGDEISIIDNKEEKKDEVDPQLEEDLLNIAMMESQDPTPTEEISIINQPTNEDEISLIINKEEKKDEVDLELEDLINIAKMESEEVKVTETPTPKPTEEISIINQPIITQKQNDNEKGLVTKIKLFIKTLCKNEFVKEAAPCLDNKSDLLDLVSNGLDFNNEQDAKFFQIFSNYTSSLDKPVECSGNGETESTEN